jgi:hypothetical protein
MDQLEHLIKLLVKNIASEKLTELKKALLCSKMVSTSYAFIVDSITSMWGMVYILKWIQGYFHKAPLV